jgi:hypothetical protein
MVIDDGGAIWLSNPWLAAVMVTVAVGLVLWCHRWLETGSAPRPHALGVQAVRMARGRSATRSTTAPPILRTVARSSSSGIGAHGNGASSFPRSAA